MADPYIFFSFFLIFVPSPPLFLSHFILFFFRSRTIKCLTLDNYLVSVSVRFGSPSCRFGSFSSVGDGSFGWGPKLPSNFLFTQIFFFLLNLLLLIFFYYMFLLSVSAFLLLRKVRQG